MDSPSQAVPGNNIHVLCSQKVTGLSTSEYRLHRKKMLLIEEILHVALLAPATTAAPCNCECGWC